MQNVRDDDEEDDSVALHAHVVIVMVTQIASISKL